MHRQVGVIVGAVTLSSTAISTQLFATTGARCREGVVASAAMQRAVLCHSRVCSFVEHEKGPTHETGRTASLCHRFVESENKASQQEGRERRLDVCIGEHVLRQCLTCGDFLSHCLMQKIRRLMQF